MNTIKNYTLIVIFIFLGQEVFSQWLTSGNTLTGTEIFGTNNNFPLRIFNDASERIRITNGTYADPGLGNQNVTRLGYSIQDGVSTPISNPFSIHHLGEQTSTVFQRTWFNVGTTYGINTDLMYVGLKKNPEDDGTEERTDAVIAWGDNSIGSQTGPDVLPYGAFGYWLI